MTNETNGIDDTAIDTLSVAPDGVESSVNSETGQGDAGGDATIADHLHDDPDDSDARLDRGLDESMDASDPPAMVQPGHGSEPAPSSGYDADAERDRTPN